MAKEPAAKREYAKLGPGLIIILFAAFISCGKQASGWKGSIVKEKGITIIKNIGQPIYREDVLILKEELVLGRREGEKDPLFINIWSIDIDENESIYVLDNKSADVKVFDRNGHLLRAIGSRGQGPGELQNPQFIQVNDGKHELIIYDQSVSRFLFFSLEGKYLRQLSTARLGHPLEPIRWDNRGNLIASVVPLPIEGGIELVKLNDKLEMVMLIHKQEKDDSFLRREHKILGPALFCVVSMDGNVIWGSSEKYELQILNNEGKVTKKITRVSKAQKITGNAKKQLESRFSRTSVAKFGYKPIFPKFFPFFQEIAVDNEGRIFVLTYEKSSGQEGYSYYDIFDPAGRYIAKVSPKIRATALCWKKSRLYTIERDEEGYNYVKRYNLLWKY